jgi:60 kDa SS-A/Ro ribonucleoprotein
MKFNTPGQIPVAQTAMPSTTTFEGAPSFKLDSIMELYMAVATTLMGEPKFYESGDDRAKRIRRLISSAVTAGEVETVAKLAVYCRETLNLRSVPIFITVTLAKELRDQSIKWDGLRRLTNRVIQRADEVREMFAASESIFGDATDNKLFKRTAPKALLKGIGDALNKFDEYQVAKYRGGSGSVSFKDVLRVVHPKPANESKGLMFAKIMADTLAPADTWENKISNDGSTSENWQSVANDPKVGIMAKLRNLRNFVKHNVDLTNVIAHLTNPTAVLNSKQLPFRWYTAYRELGGSTLKKNWYYNAPTPDVAAPAELLSALEDAFDLSIANLPDLGDDVLIIADQSGSMQSPISSKSTVTCAEIAAVLATGVWFNQTRLGKRAFVAGFADRGKVYSWSKRTSALSAAKEMMNTDLGGSSRIDTAWQAAKDAGLKPTTIIVLSDMQMTGSGGYSRYDSIMNPEAYGLADVNVLKLSINLQGYDNTPLASNNGWYQLSGWSEKIFNFVEAMRDPSGAIDIIKNSITL